LYISKQIPEEKYTVGCTVVLK